MRAGKRSGLDLTEARMHAMEVAELRRQLKGLEEARAGLLMATKDIRQPLEQALNAEVTKRRFLEAELEALRQERADVAVAHEAEAEARRMATLEIERREAVEAHVNQQLHRVKEYIASYDEKVERVRKYAEALEITIEKMETERAAIEVRWKDVCTAQITTAQLKNALELASAQRKAVETSEHAKAVARAAVLEAKIAKAAAAAAEAKAAAAVVSEKEMAAMNASVNLHGKNDAELRQAIEGRMEALTMELETTKARYDARLVAAGQAEAAKLEEAEERVAALERQLAAAREESSCLVEWNSAKTHEAHLSSIVQAHEMQLKVGEAASKLFRAEGEAKHAPTALLAPLEQSVADAAVHLEHAMAEAEAKAQCAELVHAAALDAEKEMAETNAACTAEKVAAEKEGGTSTAYVLEKEVKEHKEARSRAEDMRMAAHKEYLDASMRAERMEKQALKVELDAERPAKGSFSKPTEQQRVEAERAKVDADALRKNLDSRLESKLADAQKQLDTWLKEAERAKKDHLERFEANMQKKVTQIEGKRELQLQAIGKKLSKVQHMANVKMEQAIAEANEKRAQRLAANRRKCEQLIAETEKRRGEVVAEAESMATAAVAAANAAAIQAVGSRWPPYVKAKLFSGDATNLTYPEIETALATAVEAVAAYHRNTLEAKATTAQVMKRSAGDLATARTALQEATQSMEGTLQKAISACDLRQEETNELTRKAAARETAVKAALRVSAEHDSARRAVDEAAAAKEAELRAREEIAQAEAEHARVEAEAAEAIDKEQKAEATALASTQQQLEAAEQEEQRVRAIQLAAEEADVARQEATEKRAMVEADRRRAEEVRITSLHDAIGRRAGGKQVLQALRGGGALTPQGIGLNFEC